MHGKIVVPVLSMSTYCMMAYVASTGTVLGNDESTGWNQPLVQLAQASGGEQDAQGFIDEGDQYRRSGEPEKAIEAYRKAESLGAGSEVLTLEIADTYLEMGRDRDAYWEYRKLANSTDMENAMVACEQMEQVKYARNKSLPEPYFADLAVSIGWQSIGDAAYVDSKARFGAFTSAQKPLEYYIFGKYTKDNRSGIVGEFPVEYFENLGVLGVGFQQPLLDDPWLVFVAEAGWARDLEEFGRDREREDYVAGVEYYNEWNTGYDCRSTNTRPNRFILSVSSELKYYSRYDDAWLYEIDVRPGIRLVENRKSNLDAFVKLFHGINLKQSENNYSELGVGLTWWPDRQHDFSITASVNETYFDSGDSDTNYGVVLDYYVNW